MGRALAAASSGGAATLVAARETRATANAFDGAAEHVITGTCASTLRSIPRDRFLASNNLACHRATALAAAVRRGLRRRGRGSATGARGSRTKIGPPTLVPDAVVVHSPRLTLRRFWRQQVRYGRGAYRFAGARLPRPHGVGFYVSLARAGCFADGLRRRRPRPGRAAHAPPSSHSPAPGA